MQHMQNLLTWLSRRRFPYEPLITVEISKSRLLHNLAEFRKLAPRPTLAPKGAVAPVLKSNAYGHGLLEVANILEKTAKKGGKKNSDGIPFFIVDSYFEAVALRARRIKTPLLIIGYTRPEAMMRSRLHDVAFTVTSLGGLESLSVARSNVRVHIKVDTGMRRQGIMPEEAEKAIGIIRDNPSIILEGVCSHLSDADNGDESFTESQIHIWNRIAKKFREAFPSLKYTHLAATDGHYFSHDIEANVSRLGIGLYGLSENQTLTAKLDLRPVMEMKTVISQVKDLKTGESAGYGRTFKAYEDMTIATIPVGYFEGIDRRLSSRIDGAGSTENGFIQVGPGRVPCPIIGRVSMNITTIDISKIGLSKVHGGAKIGDTAIVISNNATDPNSIVSIAKKCGTISYEIAVKIPAHLKRVIVD